MYLINHFLCNLYFIMYYFNTVVSFVFSFFIFFFLWCKFVPLFFRRFFKILFVFLHFIYCLLFAYGMCYIRNVFKISQNTFFCSNTKINKTTIYFFKKKKKVYFIKTILNYNYYSKQMYHFLSHSHRLEAKSWTLYDANYSFWPFDLVW